MSGRSENIMYFLFPLRSQGLTLLNTVTFSHRDIRDTSKMQLENIHARKKDRR